jgi:hypothetical protein
MRPIVIKNFFSEDLMSLIKMQVDFFKSSEGHTLGVSEDREIFFRKQVHNPDLFKALHILMESRACEIFKDDVKPSYVFVSMYDDDRAICPLHTDRPQCKYTIDLCLNQKEPWDIFINDEAYSLNPGDAVAYSGTDHPHYRNQIAKGNFCDLAFFHFVQKSFNGGLD